MFGWHPTEPPLATKPFCNDAAELSVQAHTRSSPCITFQSSDMPSILSYQLTL